MASKLFLRFVKPRAPLWCMMLQKSKGPQIYQRRTFLGLIPPSQYDLQIKQKKFTMGYVMSSAGYEILPLFVITAGAIGWVIFAICWAVKTKVDVVFKTHSRNNLSRTMDLNHPRALKMIIINQVYEPWPEMADAICQLRNAEIAKKLC